VPEDHAEAFKEQRCNSTEFSRGCCATSYGEGHLAFRGLLPSAKFVKKAGQRFYSAYCLVLIYARLLLPLFRTSLAKRPDSLSGKGDLATGKTGIGQWTLATGRNWELCR
jgi:hypothetical protein